MTILLISAGRSRKLLGDNIVSFSATINETFRKQNCQFQVHYRGKVWMAIFLVQLHYQAKSWMPILLVSAALHYQTKVWVEILLIQLHYQAKFCSTIFLALTALSSKILDDNIVSFSCTIKHKHLGPSRVIRKLFTGATSSDLAHYVIAMIQEGCYEQVIIHLNINDLLNRNSSENTV